MQQPTNDIAIIHFLRGIASLSVCWFHFTNGRPDFLPIDNTVKMTGAYGWLGVEIFFIISGFIIPYTLYCNNYHISRFKGFMIKRIVRIEPAYLASIILVIILGYLSTLSPYYKGEAFNVDLKSLVLHLFYLNAFFSEPWLNVVFWTLAIEFQYYLFIAIVFPLLVHNRLLYRVITTLALLGLSKLIPQTYLFFHYLPLFLVGIVCFQFRCGLAGRNESFSLGLICIATCQVFAPYIMPILALVVALMILYVKISYNRFFWLGTVSYSLYLIHVPIGGRVINLSTNFVEAEWARVLICFITLAICVFAASLFYLLIEKPTQQLSRKIAY
ncbi:MAG: acyltransferase [Gammaproteobacteria bacterium]|nr:acyltransferase [Gammaproteobacteria bacterium]MDH5730517.1 acyltransferase [Gammaproteobacteria bacterium]